MKLTGLNFIGYNTSGGSASTFNAVNPATLEPLGTTFVEAGPAEVARAAELAEAAFQPYRAKTAGERAAFLEAIAEEILALGDTLINRCTAETALPEARLIGERGRTVNQLKLFAEVVREGSWADIRIDTAQPDRAPVPRPDIRQMQIPIGPVGIFGASNFPLAFSVAGGDTASALAAGCPVVVKAHPLHPGTSELAGRAILSAARKTGMPEGVFSLVQGMSNETGLAIVQHPRIMAIGFTGSFRGGRAIFDAASQRPAPIPVYAEMGSTNPVFILPGALRANADNIAKGLLASLSLGVGQFCTNPGLFITSGPADTRLLLGKLGAVIGQTQAGVMLSSGIRNNYESGVRQWSGSPGVSLALAGSPAKGENGAQTRVYIADAAAFIANNRLSEEVFGPAALCITPSSKEELYALAEALEGQLTATAHGTVAELAEYAGLMRILERKVGRLVFNGYPTGVEVCYAMAHGGPYPATTAPQSTSVGTAAIRRFTRPLCYQDFPQQALPPELADGNPLGIWRLVNGEWRKGPV
ncbi:MAG: aldehyde dehydrogenase (NADP(+)) [Phaeodactylibacter sp.]|nr:aldehyde dehydrogenase (NADP(+)) [Phaeodactylibacter sp.]MCB9277020.1 aldehyde dehydrogenase (NADP(+)) [Lewinellaceae bacterium]